MEKTLKRKFEIADVLPSTMYVDHEFFIPTTGNVQNLYTDKQLYQITNKLHNLLCLHLEHEFRSH